MKKFLAFIMTFFLIMVMLSATGISVQAKEDNKTNQGSLEIESPSVLLMELNSGQVLYEKDPDTARKPASVTKVMTIDRKSVV